MLTSSTQFRFLSRTATMHKHFNTRAWWKMYTPKWSLTPSSSRLAVASSPESLLVLQGHQGGSGRQRLHQAQGRQAQVRGPRGSSSWYRTCAGRQHRWRRRRHPRHLAWRERSCSIRRGGTSTGPQPWGQEPGRGQQGAGGSRPKADKLVCSNLNRHLNLNRHDTRWQQPIPAYRPASLANQKAAAKRIYQCTYTAQQCLYKVQWCLYILRYVCSLLYTLHQLHKPLIYSFVHCMYMFIWFKTCI